MNTALTALFSHVCGQGLDHTWMPGGLALPVCQRCTGLYVGAAMAFVLQLWFRPQATPAWRWAHGLFLLQMVPFGYHWLPQGPVVRTMTGVLFAFGLVSYLWLLPSEHFRAATEAKKRQRPHWAHLSFLQTHGLESPCHVAWASRPCRKTEMSLPHRLFVLGGWIFFRRPAGYGPGIVATLTLVPLASVNGGTVIAGALSVLCTVGLLVLAAMASTNLFLLSAAAWHHLRRAKVTLPA